MKGIKFRLIKDNKVVGYEKPFEQINGIFQWQYQVKYTPKKDEIIGESGWSGRFIKHDTKDRYTGLKDRNSREIYGEDIVNFNGKIGKIFWEEYPPCFRSTLTSKKQDYWYQYLDMITVIGNTHENPKLLSDLDNA